MENQLKLKECGIGVKLWGNRTKFINCNCFRMWRKWKTVIFVKTCQNKKMQIVYHESHTSTKMSYFSVFLSRIMQNSWKGWTRDKTIDLYEEISFLGKICCFYQKQKSIFEKLWLLVHMVSWPYSTSVPNFRTIWSIF